MLDTATIPIATPIGAATHQARCVRIAGRMLPP